MGMVDHKNIPLAAEVCGLDVSQNYAAAVRARRNRSGIEYETLLVATGDEVTSALAARGAAAPPTSLRVIAAALPVTLGSTRWLTAPLAQPAKARRVLPSLLDVHLPFPLESCIYGFLGLAPTDDNQMRALALAAPKVAVKARLDELEAWNSAPHVLDHEGLACWDYHQGTIPPDHRPSSIVVYLGHDRTVWATGSHGILAHTHATARVLTSTNADAWHERINRMLRSALPENRASTVHWYWTGPGAADAARRATAEARLQRQSVPLVFHVHDDPATFLARALATRVLTRSPWAWNYRQGPETHPEIVRRRTATVRRTAWTGLAAGLCLMAINFGVQRYMHSREQAADDALAAWTRTITGHDQVIRGQEVLLAERAVTDEQAVWGPLLSLQDPGLLHDWAALLHTAARHKLHFDMIRLRPDEIQVRGTAGDWDASESFVRQWEQQGWQVNIQQQDVTDTRRVRFRVDAQRGGTGS